MKAFRITVAGRIRFATSASQAPGIRKELCAALGLKSNVGEWVEIEVPGTRATIAFLNELMETVEAAATEWKAP